MADEDLLARFKAVAPNVQPDSAADPLLNHFSSIAPSAAATSSPAAAPSPSPNAVWPASTRIPAYLGSQALSGAASDLDLLGGAVRAVGNPALVNGAGNRVMLPGEIPRATSARDFTSPEPPISIVDVLRQAGLVDNPALAPQSPQERIAGSAAAGVGASIPLLPFGPAAATLASGALGGAAGEATRQTMPADTSEAVPATVGALAGLGVGGIVNATRAGTSIPSIARGLGSAETVEGAGTAVQQAARQWIKDTFVGDPAAGRLSQVEQIKAAIPPIAPTTLTPMNNYSQMVRDLLAGGSGRYGGAGSPFSSKFIESLDKQLNSIGSDATWSEAEGIQRKIGQLIANPTLDHSADQTEVDALYKALLSDRQSVATANGIGLQFDAANAEIHNLYNIRRGVMSKITKGDEPDYRPGDVASQLMAGGVRQGSDLKVLRDTIPSAVDELGAGHLQSVPKAWTRLSPEAKEQLVPDSATRLALDAALPDSTAISPMAHAIQAVAGGGFGSGAGHAISQWFPGVHPLVTGGILEMLGYLAPSVFRGTKNLVTNPNSALQPLMGAGGAGAGKQP